MMCLRATIVILLAGLLLGCQSRRAQTLGRIDLALTGAAEYLVDHGFVSLILDSFGPRDNGHGWVCETFDRLMAARPG